MTDTTIDPNDLDVPGARQLKALVVDAQQAGGADDA